MLFLPQCSDVFHTLSRDEGHTSYGCSYLALLSYDVGELALFKQSIEVVRENNPTDLLRHNLEAGELEIIAALLHIHEFVLTVHPTHYLTGFIGIEGLVILVEFHIHGLSDVTLDGEFINWCLRLFPLSYLIDFTRGGIGFLLALCSGVHSGVWRLREDGLRGGLPFVATGLR